LGKGIIVEGTEAWAIVTEFTESESLCRHMLAVEAAMGLMPLNLVAILMNGVYMFHSKSIEF
jgi:hypothetical protein